MSSTNTKNNLLRLTDKAIAHFEQLLQEEEPGTNVRVDIDRPMTQYADLLLTFCFPGEEDGSDLQISFANFILYLSKTAQSALQDAVIDFVEDELGGQLSVKAPYIKGRPPEQNSSLEERVDYLLNTEINPSLAKHGGMVSLVDILDGKIVLLKFGGGCHGCGMADVTLKQGIETTLKKSFPEITEIRDITEHATGVNPYYK